LTMGRFTTIEDIKTQDDLNIRGWEFRIMQAEEDIYNLTKRKTEMEDILAGLLEKKRKEGQRDNGKKVS